MLQEKNSEKIDKDEIEVFIDETWWRIAVMKGIGKVICLTMADWNDMKVGGDMSILKLLSFLQVSYKT